MHISEGVLSGEVLIGGGVLCAISVAYGLKKIKEEDIPKTAILTSTFFVASLIHVPLGPSSVHLILNGLCGLILGPAIFPALLVALFFQAILFQFGGLTVLGVNTLNMALPGYVFCILFRPMIKAKKRLLNLIGGFLCGSLSVAGAGILVALSLYLSHRGFSSAAKMILLAHFPIMIIEGTVTAIAVSFIKKTKPEIILILLLLSLPSECLCHRVNVFCYVDGERINCEAKFSPGGPVKKGKIKVYSVQTGELLLSSETDEQGKVSFKIPEPAIKQRWDLKIVCEAGMGHRNFWIIKSDELPEKKEKVEIAPSEKSLEALISRIIQRELSPIKRDLAELKERRISFQDIIGGIGYIFGIAGIVLYLMSKKRSSPR